MFLYIQLQTTLCWLDGPDNIFCNPNAIPWEEEHFAETGYLLTNFSASSVTGLCRGLKDALTVHLGTKTLWSLKVHPVLLSQKL